jgi:hypothetical protein
MLQKDFHARWHYSHGIKLKRACNGHPFTAGRKQPNAKTASERISTKKMKVAPTTTHSPTSPPYTGAIRGPNILDIACRGDPSPVCERLLMTNLRVSKPLELVGMCVAGIQTERTDVTLCVA